MHIQENQTSFQDDAKDKRFKPMAKRMFEPISTPRPPRLSMVLPTEGPSNAERRSDDEKAANTEVVDIPVSRAIGSARIARR